MINTWNSLNENIVGNIRNIGQKIVIGVAIRNNFVPFL